MEFKGSEKLGFVADYKVLIESDWNLKVLKCAGISVSKDVLIESDWNLKDDGKLTASIRTLVLIESDWNLKKTDASFRTVDFPY